MNVNKFMIIQWKLYGARRKTVILAKVNLKKKNQMNNQIPIYALFFLSTQVLFP